jgi:UDPglucose 6-dehydrogenase
MTHVLSVIGTGYLGATHAACMSSLGFTVVGIDSNAEKILQLSKGSLPFYEPGLEEILQAELASGRLTFTTNFSAAKNADVHFICVGTPQQENSLAADLTFVEGAIAAIAPHLKLGSLVVGKSTVPVGTAERLTKQLAILAPNVDLAWNPEFLREGFAVEDTLRPNRIVVGVTSDHAEEVLREVYTSMLTQGTPWIRADLQTSELVKVAANSFLATKISFINAMAEICEVVGGDVTILARAIGYDPRIGNKFLGAGIGFGGGCIPKDIRAFIARSEELGILDALKFLREVDADNLRARQRVIEVVRQQLSADLSAYKIAVLGAAFKPDSDDVRDSPALDIAAQLHAAGATVTVHDPKAIANAKQRFPSLNFSENVIECISGSDLVLHLTEWREYRDLKPADLISFVNAPRIIDGRNTLNRDLWVSAGWKFHALGRPDA